MEKRERENEGQEYQAQEEKRKPKEETKFNAPNFFKSFKREGK